MSQEQRHSDTSSEDEELDNDHQLEYSIASDNLEFVPTLLKVKQIILLRHKELIKLINDFNTTLETFTRDEPHYLAFTIVPNSDSNILWKALIRIKCSKTSRADRSETNEIILNLQQFLSVHQSLCQQISTLQKCPPRTLVNSSPGDDNSSFSTAKLSFNVPSDNECCICMDRKPNLVLPCTHRFCDECFRQWSSQTNLTSSQTCPLCRVDTNSDSGFVLAETPKYDSVKKMLTESILSLPDDLRNRNSDGSSSRPQNYRF